MSADTAGDPKDNRRLRLGMVGEVPVDSSGPCIVSPLESTTVSN